MTPKGHKIVQQFTKEDDLIEKFTEEAALKNLLLAEEQENMDTRAKLNRASQ